MMGMPHLRSVALDLPNETQFPFSVPVIRALGTLDVDHPVTCLVGENGSGKSTLLEALALAAKLPTVGSARGDRDATLEAQRRLAKRLKLTWRARSFRGFFLRAEDFFGFTKSLATERAEYLQRLRDIDAARGARTRREAAHRRERARRPGCHARGAAAPREAAQAHVARPIVPRILSPRRGFLRVYEITRHGAGRIPATAP